MRALRQLLLTPLLAVMMVGCVIDITNAQSTSTPARDQLVADLKACTNAHGYDPKATAGVGEHELAPNELQWRMCAYDKMRAYSAAHPDLSGPYQQLINEDITMTNAVQSGTMTRTQRRQRLEELFAQVENAEKKQAMSGAADKEEEQKKVRQVVDGVRGFGY